MTILQEAEPAKLESGGKTEGLAMTAPISDSQHGRGISISTRVAARPDSVGTIREDGNLDDPDLWLGNSGMTDKDDLGAVPDASMLSLFRGLVNFLMEESRKRGWQDISDNLEQVNSAIARRGDGKQGPN
ncbi:MAG: hypothetical protein ACKOED_06500 [Aestuariivirga sp.]|uniref:hypothetical protein n=1 Tax=Aestuariivirga sp. TaxID=2650926 RepID=UPI0038D0EEF7